MRRHTLFFVLLTTIAFTTVFLLGYKFGDLQKFAADLVATINLQKNATPSGNATTSLESNIGSTSTPTLADVLQELQGQEQLLANQVIDLRSQLEVTNLRAVFTRIMKRGDSGDDVSKLQELLGKIPGIYPPEVNSSDTVTGYYGSLTKMAITEFQARAGLKQTGVVDQDTRKKLYESAANLIVDENVSAKFTPIDLSTLTDLDLQNLKSLQNQISRPISNSSNTQTSLTDLQNQIFQLASGASSTQASIADLQNQISQITSDISNIQASIAALNPPPLPSPTPSPTPTPSPSLAISTIQVTNITKTSSTIAWMTNSPSTSEVDYSQNSSMPANQMLTISSPVMTTKHSLVLLQLNANTKYYYRVVSKDSTGAVASSTNLSFNTLP